MDTHQEATVAACQAVCCLLGNQLLWLLAKQSAAFLAISYCGCLPSWLLPAQQEATVSTCQAGSSQLGSSWKEDTLALRQAGKQPQ